MTEDKTYYYVTMNALYCSEFNCSFDGGVSLKKVAFSAHEREAFKFDTQQEADEVASVMQNTYGAQCTLETVKVAESKQIVRSQGR